MILGNHKTNAIRTPQSPKTREAQTKGPKSGPARFCLVAPAIGPVAPATASVNGRGRPLFFTIFASYNLPNPFFHLEKTSLNPQKAHTFLTTIPHKSLIHFPFSISSAGFCKNPTFSPTTSSSSSTFQEHSNGVQRIHSSRRETGGETKKNH